MEVIYIYIEGRLYQFFNGQATSQSIDDSTLNANTWKWIKKSYTWRLNKQWLNTKLQAHMLQ